MIEWLMDTYKAQLDREAFYMQIEFLILALLIIGALIKWLFGAIKKSINQ